MNNQSPAQNKFISHLLKRDPKLGEKDIPPLVNSFKRFVKVVQKIYTEPQAQIIIKNKKRIITTDIKEFKKVFDKDNPKQDLLDTFRKFHKSVTKDKYGR
ncbi:hypothetical protein KKD37_01180 [Patescibacteria group bacterium]|nr:hypothetical protein [Patescibacteria group bacterium]